MHGLRKPIAFTGENHNVAVVNQPVNQDRCQAVVSKNRVPLRELRI